MADWADVGGNPCPGDVSALRSYSAGLQTVSERGRELESQVSELHRGIGSLRWTGAGAQNITALVDNAVPPLAKYWTAQADAAAALRGFADRLDDAQHHAQAALRSYSEGATSLATAQRQAGDAAHTYAAADAQVRNLDQEIRELQSRRIIEQSLHHPTVTYDHEIMRLSSQRSYQLTRRLQSAAAERQANSTSAATRAQMDTARRRLDALRAECANDRRAAAHRLLEDIGAARSTNPFLREWQDVVGVAEGAAHWVNDNQIRILHDWDHVADGLAVLALVCAPIPAVGEVVLAVSATASLIDALGHLYEAANGRESLGGAILAVALALPIGGALGRLARVDKDVFEDTPGIAKRLIWFANAQHAKGVFSSSGTKLIGEYRYRIHAVPKPVIGPPSLYKTLLVAKAAQNVGDDFEKVHDDLHRASEVKSMLRKALAPSTPTTNDSSSDQDTVPITTLRLPSGATSDALQGSTVRIQG